MTLRILHCPTDTGGNAWTLAQAERRLGLESTVLVYHSTWLGYPNDVDLRLREKSRLRASRAVGRLMLRVATEFDIVHFNGGRSMMPTGAGAIGLLRDVELATLRRLGKGIVVTYQGCDVRQRTLCRRLFEVNACEDCTHPCSADFDRHKASMARQFGRYADHIFALNPDLLHVLPPATEFLPYTTVDLRDWHYLPAPVSDRFTIVHAPTNRAIKGTSHIIDVVGRLKARHPDIELVLNENMSHDEVKAAYARANLVIDQLLVGWYGGVAVEAMALGRPVVCFLRESDIRLLPSDMRRELPVISADPGSLETILEGLLDRRDALPALGWRSRQYVERWHDPMSVAARVRREYDRIAMRRRRSSGSGK
jgi:hypothetical protein